jgi:hypothetical protein
MAATEAPPSPAPSPVPARAQRWVADPRLPLILFGALLVVAAGVLLYAGRGTTFYSDEWSFLFDRRGGGLDALLEGHNGHLSLLPVLIYKVVWSTTGLDHHGVLSVVLTLLHLVAAVLLFALVRPRLGVWPAVGAGTLLAFLGAAWEDILWPFQIGYVGSVAAGLGMWLALDRRTAAGDYVAAACLLAALACSGLGVPLAAGAIVEIGWRRDWRRLAIVAGAPVALYALWYLGYGESQLRRDSFTRAPQWFADAAASAAGALLGRASDWGRALLVLVLAGLFWRLASPRRISPRLLGLGAAGVSFWALTAGSRAGVELPEASRYTYLGAVVVLLAIVELLEGVPLRPRVLALAGLILVVGVAQNLTSLAGNGRFLRDVSASIKAELTAVELQGKRAPAGYTPDGHRMPQLQAGPYLRLIDEMDSSPAYSSAELVRASESARREADRVLREIGVATPTRAPDAARGGAPPPVDAGEQVTPNGACVTWRPPGPGANLDLTVPETGLLITAIRDPANVTPRRFQDKFPEQPTATVPARATQAIAPPRDASPTPWHVRLAGAGPVRACTRAA